MYNQKNKINQEKKNIYVFTPFPFFSHKLSRFFSYVFNLNDEWKIPHIKRINNENYTRNSKSGKIKYKLTKPQKKMKKKNEWKEIRLMEEKDKTKMVWESQMQKSN